MCIHHIIHDVNPSFQGYNLREDRERKCKNKSSKKPVNINLLIVPGTHHFTASPRIHPDLLHFSQLA